MKLLPSRGVPIYANLASFPEGSNGELGVDESNGNIYESINGTWTLVAGAGGISAVSDTNSIDLTVSSATLSAALRYLDTNTVDLGVGGSGLTAAVRYQDSTSVNLSDDAGGLKAELLLSASGANSGYFNASSNIRADGLQVEVPQSGVRSSPLTGYTAASGTVADTDTVLGAFQKIGYHISQHEEAQIVTVAKSGAMYTTIQAAINAISDASSTKPYAIHIAPGVYTEDLTLKDWVFLQNGLSGSVTVVGKIVGTGLSGSCGIRGITVQKTPTADGQIGVEISGGIFYLVDVDVYLLGSADYVATGIKATSGTALTVFNSTVWDRRTGNITKALTAWEFAGSGTFGIFNASASARCSYTAGTSCLFSVTGTGSFTMSGGAAIWASSSAFSGEIRGFCTTSATDQPRIATNVQIRLTGTSGGTATASHLDTGDNSGRIDLSGCFININGFTTENATNTDTTDSQRLYLTTTNKTLAKAGAGLASITPFDLVQTGFTAWGGSGNYWSYDTAQAKLTILRPGIGLVNSAQVVWASQQSPALTDKSINYVYMNSSGVIGATTSLTNLYENNIVLFQVWRNGTNYLVCKENHPCDFTTKVSLAWHEQFGPLLHSASTSLASVNTRQVAVNGANVIGDHGLTSTVAAAVGGATWTILHTDAAGAMQQYSTATANLPEYYNNAGTPTLLTAGANRWVVYRLGAIKDKLQDGTETAQFVAVMDTQQQTSSGNATSRVNSGSAAPFPAELKALEVVQLGYAVVRKTSGGAIDTSNVPPTTLLQVFGAAFVAGGSSNTASLINTDATNFDKILSASDTTVQLALETIDENAAGKSLANVFTQEQTIANIIITNNATNASGVGDVSNASAFASANNLASSTFTFGSRGVIMFEVDVNTDGGFVVACDYKATTFNVMSDPSNLFLDADSGTGIYISKSANSAVITVKNRMGGAKTIGILAIRSKITAATAWA